MRANYQMDNFPTMAELARMGAQASAAEAAFGTAHASTMSATDAAEPCAWLTECPGLRAAGPCTC
jgi:hypothetical protein